MSWPPEQRTSGLYSREYAEELKAERRAANPKCRYRLVRVTTTYTIEVPQ